MIAREEDFGHSLALEFARARILRIAKQDIEERIRRRGRIIAEHTGQHTRRCIHHQHGGDLAARQHEVTDGDAAIGEIVNACIESLIVPADEDELLVGSKFLCHLLREHFPCRIKDNRAAPLCERWRLCPDIAHGSVERLRL